MTPATLLLALPLTTGQGPAGCPANCAPAPAAYAGPSYAPPLQYLAPTGQLPDWCRPIAPPAPLLYTKLLPDAGLNVTLLPGTPDALSVVGPATVGFRPGYVHRFAVNGLPNRPGVTLYPELEVRGSLVPRNGMKYWEYPVPLALSAAELARAADGLLLTKVFYLEDPERAVPVRTTPDRPFEELVGSDEEAMHRAETNGRLVLVLRIGNRVPDAATLQHSTVPNTVLLPGRQQLSAPAAGPVLGWRGVELFDPILGPKYNGEECAPDGGDRGVTLGVNTAGKLAGLDPADVSAEYSSGGKRKVTTSNTVCLCVPRFAVSRVEAGPGALQLLTKLQSDTQAFGPKGMHDRVAAQGVSQRVKPIGAVANVGLAQEVGVTGVHALYAPLVKPQAVGTANGLMVVAMAVAPDETTNLPDELLVTKSFDPPAGVKIGDEVTVTLKYSNRTRATINDLVLSDNLGPRFEYVPGSSQSDRPANTTTEPNGTGSVVVRFDLPGALPSGQDGVVKFKVRVR